MDFCFDSVVDVPQLQARAIFVTDTTTLFKEDGEISPIQLDEHTQYVPAGADGTSKEILFANWEHSTAPSDEEYITLLAECLNKSDYTTGDILTHHPDIYLKIMGSFYYMGEEKAVFLSELYEDARKIMETVGDQTPNY